jgi:hypothetical protein
VTQRFRFHSAGHHPVSSTHHYFTAGAAMIAALPLSDAEKAEAVRRVLQSID